MLAAVLLGQCGSEYKTEAICVQYQIKNSTRRSRSDDCYTKWTSVSTKIPSSVVNTKLLLTPTSIHINMPFPNSKMAVSYLHPQYVI